MQELDDVLKGFFKKNSISRDALGYINELFKPDIWGEDLKLAILTLVGLGGADLPPPRVFPP